MDTTNLMLQPTRNSMMLLNEVYFWTNTIKDWKHLLKEDKYKQFIADTLCKYAEAGLIKVYAFVIMPNHIHILWELNRMNGREKPYASFNKETAHYIIKDLNMNHREVLPYFEVSEKSRKYRIWKRDPLAVWMDKKQKVEQKIDYIHTNPVAEKWSLTKTPEEYYWSSASFYEKGDNRFGFLTDYREAYG